MFEFLKGKKDMKISKAEIAKLLSISPEDLESFEKAYATQVLNNGEVSKNYFEINSRQAASMHKKVEISYSPQLEDIKRRIVNELLARADVWKFDGKEVRNIKPVSVEPNNLVTNDEIEKLPKELRPQLTGILSKADIKELSYISLMDSYWHYLNEKNPKKSRIYYHMFRQGLDILDLDEVTRRIIATNPDSMGNWLPYVTNAVLATKTFSIPKTTIVKVPTTMLQLTRCEYSELTRTTLDIVNDFCFKAFGLNELEEYFIKTGTYASKFDFRNAYVHEPKEVREIGEYLLFIHQQALQMASPLCVPVCYGASTTDEWVVREFIKDKENNPIIYKGLPLHTEYRVFVDLETKQVLGMTPYWEPETMKNQFAKKDNIHDKHDFVTYCTHEKVLMGRYNQNKEYVKEQVKKLILNIEGLTGQWSIDIMQNGDEFWIIDMALAENSTFYKECVPRVLRKRLPENWIPELK